MAHIIEIWRLKYLSWRHLPNRWIVCNKTKYGHKYQRKKERKKERKTERKKKVASFEARPYQIISTVIFRLAAAFATNLSLVVHRHRSCEKIELLQFRVQGSAKENNYRLIFVQMVESLVTKVDMVMHHHEPTCHAKSLLRYLQGQSDNYGSQNQRMTVSAKSSELLILLPPNLFWWSTVTYKSIL